ncbi:MAG: AAA family ATPase [Oscillospiraceae bacterium]
MLLNGLYIKSINIEYTKIPKNDYISKLSVVKNIKKLEFNKPVTFFVGENGLGKSTLIEAIATKWGFNAEGGSKNFNFYTKRTESDLNKYISLVRGPYRPRDGYFVRAESLYNVATNIDNLDLIECNALPISLAYGGSLHNQSHGESFLTLFFKRFRGKGLYILDEPEAALSPVSQLSLLVRVKKLVNLNSQFIIATHSPILLAYPDAQIYEIKDSGVFLTQYNKTEHYLFMKSFFDDTERIIKNLLK